MAEERRWVRGRASTRWVVGLCGVMVAWACGKSVRQTGGDGRAAGGAEQGGAAADGGRDGTNAGLGGAVATGGIPTGGKAGLGGVSGSSMGGSSGQAGCETTEVEDSLAHCPRLGAAEWGQPASSCPFEATCEELHCGAPWSDFDENGCRRVPCESESACSASERCMPTALAGVIGCRSSILEGCEPYCSSCQCIGTDDCAAVAFCQPAVDFPPSDDCPVASFACNDLPYYRTMLEIQLQRDYESDIATALESCAEDVADRIAACLGTGGAPN
jgi:hypothetical protein